jgi:hypothetical protein
MGKGIRYTAQVKNAAQAKAVAKAIARHAASSGQRVVKATVAVPKKK